MDRKLVSELLGISEKSYYRWKEERKIFILLEKYFDNEDIREFLETGKILKFEFIPPIEKILIEIENKLFTKFKEFNLDNNFSFQDFTLDIDLISAKLRKKNIEISLMNILNYIDNEINKNKICYIGTLSILTDLEFKIYAKDNAWID